MNERRSARLARGVALLALSVLAAFVLLAAQRWTLITGDRGITVQGALLGAAYTVMGALIASRRPTNRIGWVFLLIGLSGSVSALAGALATNVPLGRPNTPAGAVIGLWLNQWVWGPAWFSIPTFVFLLFPDGHVPHRRFRPVAWVAGLGLTAMIVGGILSPDNAGDPAFRNPVVVAPKAVDVLQIVAILALLLAGLGSLIALIYRFRRSKGDEREQIKWFAYAGIATAVLYFGLTVEAKGWVQILGFVAIPLLPTAAAIAILRYHLYDIDRIISRTATYALVSALVAGVYVIVALVPTTMLAHGRTPSWLVAVGTIVAAAAFRPIRRRVQNTIDRRFNRSRYDAAWAIEAFASRLRDEVDIDELTNDLQTLVHQTMEPAHVSVWLRST